MGKRWQISVSFVESWVRDAWKSVPIPNIQNNINSAGFSNDFKQWHIAKHDIYRQKNLEAWENCQPNEVDPSVLEFVGQLDDLAIDDE